MIYLIGGVPRVGKSIVARAVAERSGAQLISTDDVCGAFKATLPEAERDARFPFPGFFGDASNNVLTVEELVAAQMTSAKSLQPEIERLIAEAAQTDASVVIEGVYLLPEYVRSAIERHGPDKISALFIGSSDADLVVDGIRNNARPDNWMRETDIVVIRHVAQFIVALNARLRAEAEQNGIAYQERTTDFEGDVRRFTEAVTHQSERTLPLK